MHIDTTNPDHAKVRFVLDAGHPPGDVSVVGSFNEWTPGLDTLTTQPDGTRAVVIGLAYGTRHVFRYLGPGDRWFDDEAADDVTIDGSVILPIPRHPTGSTA